MALINCPECGKQISNRAIACPNCGFPLSELKNFDFKDNQTAEPKKTSTGQSTETNKTEFSKNNAKKKSIAVGEYSFDISEEMLEHGKIRAYFDDEACIRAISIRATTKSLVKDVGDFYTKVFPLIDEEIDEMVDKGVQCLINHGCETIDFSRLSAIAKNYVDYSEHIESLEKAIEAYYKFSDNLEYLRDIQKSNRGQWAGGGFGVKGAIKGAVTAGALNVGTNMIRGIGDAFKNASDERKRKEAAQLIIQNEETWQTIQDAANFALFGVCYAVLEVLQEGNHIYKIPDATYEKDKDINAKLNNYLKAYDQGKKTENDVLEIVREGLVNYPFNPLYVSTVLYLHPELSLKANDILASVGLTHLIQYSADKALLDATTYENIMDMPEGSTEKLLKKAELLDLFSVHATIPNLCKEGMTELETKIINSRLKDADKLPQNTDEDIKKKIAAYEQIKKDFDIDCTTDIDNLRVAQINLLPEDNLEDSSVKLEKLVELSEKVSVDCGTLKTNLTIKVIKQTLDVYKEIKENCPKEKCRKILDNAYGLCCSCTAKGEILNPLKIAIKNELESLSDSLSSEDLERIAISRRIQYIFSVAKDVFPDRLQKGYINELFDNHTKEKYGIHTEPWDNEILLYKLSGAFLTNFRFIYMSTTIFPYYEINEFFAYRINNYMRLGFITKKNSEETGRNDYTKSSGFDDIAFYACLNLAIKPYVLGDYNSIIYHSKEYIDIEKELLSNLDEDILNSEIEKKLLKEKNNKYNTCPTSVSNNGDVYALIRDAYDFVFNIIEYNNQSQELNRYKGFNKNAVKDNNIRKYIGNLDDDVFYIADNALVIGNKHIRINENIFDVSNVLKIENYAGSDVDQCPINYHCYLICSKDKETWFKFVKETTKQNEFSYFLDGASVFFTVYNCVLGVVNQNEYALTNVLKICPKCFSSDIKQSRFDPYKHQCKKCGYKMDIGLPATIDSLSELKHNDLLEYIPQWNAVLKKYVHDNADKYQVDIRRQTLEVGASTDLKGENCNSSPSAKEETPFVNKPASRTYDEFTQSHNKKKEILVYDSRLDAAEPSTGTVHELENKKTKYTGTPYVVKPGQTATPEKDKFKLKSKLPDGDGVYVKRPDKGN